ncbi:MAG: GDSL-type esterase/lipase family protein [Jatrophihabitans sp.]|uniref:GDSL-type esterase/lipase family protein n=1 Tax=Jatrophihabitans sp. TaxID=1932789 RepID=UPI003F8068CB
MADWREYRLLSGQVQIRGAFDFDMTAGGVVPRRLPAWTRPRLPDANTDFVVRCGAGVRVAFSTDADTVELGVSTHRVLLDGQAAQPSSYDIRVDGAFVDTVVAVHGSATVFGSDGSSREVLGAPEVLRFDLDGAWHEIEIWLDLTTVTELQSLRATGTVRPPAAVTRPRWVHYGSSISQGAHATSPSNAWPARAAAAAGVELTALGLAGNAQLDGFVARTIADLPADFISMKVGINVVDGDTMRERTYLSALHTALDLIRAGHPDTPLLLVSPIYCPLLEQHPGPLHWTMVDGTLLPTTVGRDPAMSAGALTLQRIRELNAAVVDTRNDPALTHLSGLSLLSADDIDRLPDSVHPDDEGHQLISARFVRAAFGPDAPFAGR